MVAPLGGMLGAWGSLRACQPLLRHCAASQARAPGCVTAQRASGACRTLATAMQLQQAEGGPSEPAAGARRRVSRHGNASLPPPPMDFKRAASFDDLLQANVRFLRGELQETPYWCGPGLRAALQLAEQRGAVRCPTCRSTPNRPPTASLPPALPTRN